MKHKLDCFFIYTIGAGVWLCNVKDTLSRSMWPTALIMMVIAGAHLLGASVIYKNILSERKEDRP